MLFYDGAYISLSIQVLVDDGSQKPEGSHSVVEDGEECRIKGFFQFNFSWFEGIKIQVVVTAPEGKSVCLPPVCSLVIVPDETDEHHVMLMFSAKNFSLKYQQYQ